MLEKVKYFVSYGQAIVNYTQKVVTIISTAISNWPQWIPPVQGEKTGFVENAFKDV